MNFHEIELEKETDTTLIMFYIDERKSINYLIYCVSENSMNYFFGINHLVNEEFRFFEGIWLHRKRHQIRFFA